MSNPLTRTLERLTFLEEHDREMLDDAVVNTRSYAAGSVVGHEGKHTFGAKVILQGTCCQKKTLLNGRRQIVSVLFPGDAIELLKPTYHARNFDLIALGNCVIADISPKMIADLRTSSRIMRALILAKQIEVDTAFHWILNASGYPADIGLSRLMCELHYRMAQSIDQVDFERIKFFNQTHLAEMIGKTHVHVNRTLQSLRLRDIVNGAGGSLFSFDFGRLAKFCDFDPSYLHESDMLSSPNNNIQTELRHG